MFRAHSAKEAKAYQSKIAGLTTKSHAPLSATPKIREPYPICVACGKKTTGDNPPIYQEGGKLIECERCWDDRKSNNH